MPTPTANTDREVELKLELPAGSIPDAADLAGLGQFISGPVKREELTSVYFDTRKMKLLKQGLALRIRHLGARRVQTIKSVRKGSRGPLGRGEWEGEVKTATPDLTLAKGTALAPIAGKRLARKLRPVFETVVERQILSVHHGASDVEVAIDRGWIIAGQNRDPIHEMELEIKSGALADLTEIAERLADTMPLAYAARSKQDRGYALISGETTGAVGAADVTLASDASTGDAFRVIALACLDHALANARAVGAGDAEGVHQMRVGLRRLGAALSLFKPMIESPETDAIKVELKWLTEQLGPARDLDVLVAEGVAPLRDEGPKAEIDLLTEDLRGRRNQELNRAKQAVESDRFRSLGLRTALWILGGGGRSPGKMTQALRVRPVVDFAAETLARRLKKILKKARQIERLDPRERHKLRIAVKRLRYGADFFGGLFDRSRTQFARQLKVLQNALGRLNDIEVHKRVAGEIVHRGAVPTRPGKALAMGFVNGYERAQIEPCIATVTKAAKRLAGTTPFWE